VDRLPVGCLLAILLDSTTDDVRRHAGFELARWVSGFAM
jgi:hypothetical protein